MTIILIITLVVTNIYLLVREYVITKNIKLTQEDLNALYDEYSFLWNKTDRLERFPKELGYEFKTEHSSGWVKTKK